MHTVTLMSCVVSIYLVKKEWDIIIIRIGAFLMLLGMSLYIQIPYLALRLIVIIIIAIVIGCVGTCVMLTLVYKFNNKEKLFAIIGSMVLVNIGTLLKGDYAVDFLESQSDNIISFSVVAIVAVATFFIKQTEVTEMVNDKLKEPKFRSQTNITIIVFCAFVILNKGIGKGLLNISIGFYGKNLILWYCIGGLIGCTLYILICMFYNRAIMWIENIAFGCIAMGIFTNAFALQLSQLGITFALLSGIGNAIGNISMYYVLGVIVKKYNNMHYFRLSVILIGLCSGITSVVISNLIYTVDNPKLSAVVSMISAAVLLITLVVSPILPARYPYDCITELQSNQKTKKKPNSLQKYNLTKREEEVCMQLVKGYTMRQIAGMLSVSYSTINTYCTSIYRKLGINSRNELMSLLNEDKIPPFNGLIS